MLADCYRQLQEIDTHIVFYTQALRRHAQHNEAIQRLQTVPGFGPIVVSIRVVGSAATRTGRPLSASSRACACCWVSESTSSDCRDAGRFRVRPAVYA